MNSASFPGCCTATILHNFGGTDITVGTRTRKSKEAIRKYLQQKLDWAKGYHCLVVITNSEQKAANAVLKELGFEHSDWMSKYHHPESKIRLWWFPPLAKRRGKV